MADEQEYLALFNELDPATEAIDKLRALGIQDNQMTLLSGVPYPESVLGRPAQRSLVGTFGAFGAALGFLAGAFIIWGTPLLYPIRVGGQAMQPLPPAIVVIFELTMLGLLVFTFLGVVWESAFPTLGATHYHPNISNGEIAILFSCPTQIGGQIQQTLTQGGAISVEPTEAKKL
jgi:hypothetical protein